MEIPKYYEMFNPLLSAMHTLGGSASNSELEDEVSTILGLTDEQISDTHKGNQSKFSYKLAWARSYLKQYGLLINSERGVWALTPEGQKTTVVDAMKVKRFVRSLAKNGKSDSLDVDEVEDASKTSWEEELLDVIKEMAPDAFERLCQRILRESGFTHVEVTGKSGDGGIDGKGVVRIGGFLSFHIIFQCKRYKGSVPPSTIRDFRGAMVGRADKGLVITTGTFTKQAREEAQRDGAPPIDLIDGNALVNKLKDLGLGVVVKKQVVEEVSINREFFLSK